MKQEAVQYNRGMRLLEWASLTRLRQQVVRDVTGHVLEIGVGTGVNLPHYAQASRVTAIDVNQGRLSGVSERLAVVNGRFPITAHCADAQRLPFANGQFDTVVGTLVFCSIPHPSQALDEIRRVLKPAGRLLLLEHVRGQNKVMRHLTDWLHPAWFALQGECHLNRETETVVRQAGFTVEQSSIHGWGILQIIQAK